MSKKKKLIFIGLIFVVVLSVILLCVAKDRDESINNDDKNINNNDQDPVPSINEGQVGDPDFEPPVKQEEVSDDSVGEIELYDSVN